MELTDSEAEDLKIILGHIFGEEAATWKMNDGTLSATAKMLEEIHTCSKEMNYVPRPTYFADLSYFKRQLRDMARRTRSHDKIYEICKTTGAYQWKRAIYIASEGL